MSKMAVSLLRVHPQGHDITLQNGKSDENAGGITTIAAKIESSSKPHLAA